MKIALFEDEPPALLHLERTLARVRPDAFVVARHDTVAGARAWLRDAPEVDLIVSDIRLADGLALPLLSELDLPVVFATAYDAYVLEAFRCAAIDYLLKPIDDDEMARALAKHRRLRDTLAHSALAAVTDTLRAPRRRLIARHGGIVRAIDVNDVAYIFAEDKLTIAVTHKGDEHVVDKSLTMLERELDPGLFFRVSRAAIVSATAVRGCSSVGKGRLALSLAPRPRTTFVVPQEHGAAFRAWLDR